MPIYQGNTEINTQFVDGYGLGNIFLGTNLVQSGLTADNFISASGGTITTSGSFKIHVFDVVGTSSFVVTNPGVTGSNLIEYLIVGGGGSGGLGANYGAGGGAGGLLSGSIMATPGSFPIIVGAGGIGTNSGTANTKGADSSALGLTALGGGKGQHINFIDDAARNGGSGAGTNGITLDAAQGNNGGVPPPSNARGDGGGGAGQAGFAGTSSPNVSGNGGNGKQSSIITYDQFNSALWYAGGGGGGGGGGSTPGGTGGNGGAGSGGSFTGTAAQRSGGDASRNIGVPSVNAGYGSAGGGAGGLGVDGVRGGNGFQGVVIVKYQFKN